MERKMTKTGEKKIKLLMIEDDIDQSQLLTEVIEDHFGPGTVTAVYSGVDAMKHDLASFDMILTDVNLPDCSGMSLVGEIQKRCSTPVIMVTGENSGEMAAQAIRRGAADYVVKFGDFMFTIPIVIEKNLTVAKLRIENDELKKSLLRGLDEAHAANLQLHDTMKKVEEMAATDALTGLYNRRHFNRVLEQMFSESQRYGHDLSIVMIDLDGYKRLNDTFGHQVGDQLLTMTGKVINATLRKMDVAARYGGDEFVLLLPHAGAAEAESVVERIRVDFKYSSDQMLKRPLGVSMSIGIAASSIVKAASAEQMLSAADEALYRAKTSGKDRVCFSQGISASKV